MFTHGALRSSQELIQKCPCIPRSNSIFEGEGKTGVPGEKPLGAEWRTNYKLNPHMTPGPGIEPRPHWWDPAPNLRYYIEHENVSRLFVFSE